MKPRHKLYAQLRAKIGTQKEASKLLGIHQRTLERRESGEVKITDEMIQAVLWLGRDFTAKQYILKIKEMERYGSPFPAKK